MAKQKEIIIISSVLIIIAIAIIYVFNNKTEPKLSFSGVHFKPDLDIFGKGCLTEVSGNLSNLGTGKASEVIVNCKLIGSGSGTTMGTKNLGSIEKGEISSFKMTIDNDCPKPNDVECSVTCKNCKEKSYG